MSSKNKNSEKFAELCDRIKKAKKSSRVPGLSLGIFVDGCEYLAAYGRTSVENPLPVTNDTLFQIGSITKTMTATTLVALAELGRLDLDAPVRTLIPKFRMADTQVTENLTTRHLLSHTGGWVGDYFNDFGNGDDALARMVEKISTLTQITPLGSMWSYNNAGFYIAGRLVEIVSGLPYEAAIKKYIFAPAGMTNSWFYPDDIFITKRFVCGHEKRNNRTIVARPWAVGRAGNPVGGGLCSAAELLRWARVILSGGIGAKGHRLLRASSVTQMLAPKINAGFGRMVGLGWFQYDYGLLKLYGHSGATYGQHAAFYCSPEHNFAAALLVNSDSGRALTDSFARMFAEIWFDAAPPAPEIVPHSQLSAAMINEYTGRYELPLEKFTLTARAGGFILQNIPTGGFPTPDTPAGEMDPPIAALLCAHDRFLTVDKTRPGAVGEFIRDSSGKIQFCRLGGRVHVKK